MSARTPGVNGIPGVKSIAKLIEQLAYRHSNWQVFADFCELAATSVSNAVDQSNYEKREARYMQTVKRYEKKEVELFPQMLAKLTLAMESEPADIMGRTYHDLELQNKWAGQFFSPYPICQMMAKMTMGDPDGLRDAIAAKGYITVAEPACGSGAMVIAFAHEMKTAGINYQRHLHVTATDIDAKCVHMAYLQCSLLHIPAVIVHGNSLSNEMWDWWYTPAHIMGGWDRKLRKHEPAAVASIEAPAPQPEADIKFNKRGQGMLF